MIDNKNNFILTVNDFGDFTYEESWQYYKGDKKPDYLNNCNCMKNVNDGIYYKNDFKYKPIYDNSNTKYRMYSIVLGQLSQIQKGIQSCHSVVEYSNIYNEDNDFRVWSQIDKTLILLDAKDSNDIKDVISTLLKLDVKFSTFSEESLNNVITSVSFIVSNKIYDNLSEDTTFLEKMSSKEYKILELIKNHHLAR